MLRKLLATLLAALFLTIALMPARPARGAELQTLSFRYLTYPSSIKAGESIIFRVHADPIGENSLCCGYLYVKGPSGQSFRLFLQQAAQGRLEGKLELSPHAPSGTWELERLVLVDAQENRVTLDKNSNFNETFQVQSAGKPADTKPPVLIRVQLPEEVTAGESFAVTAMAGDDLSGVDRIYVTVGSGGEQPVWRHTVELTPTGKLNELAGQMVADPLTIPTLTHEIVNVTLVDKAGNRVSHDQARLTPNQTNRLTGKVKQRELPEGLVTSPYLKLVHPGEQGYWSWLEVDRQYMTGLLQNAGANRSLVRERIAAELPQLRAAVEELKAEVYVDPATQLKISPYATTGKWIVLDAAIWARLEMLTELERQEGLSQIERQPLTAGQINSIYALLEEGEVLLPMENSFNALYGQVPAAVLSVLARSPEAVAVLRSPAHEASSYGYYDMLDRDVFYFAPILSQRRYSIRWGQSSMYMTINPGMQLTDTLFNLFYEVGRHFGQAHLSAFDAPDATERWAEYLKPRNGQSWNLSDGYVSTPENNLGDDFAWSFLPDDLGAQYYSLQSLVRLREEPAMAKAFRELVTEKLASPPPVTSITPASFLEVGLASTLKATITPYEASTGAWNQSFPWAKNAPLKAPLTAVKSTGKAEFTVRADTVGRVAWFLLRAADSTGRTYHRNIYYYRAPVLLDPVPGATNDPILILTGTTSPNQRVSAGSATALSDRDGKFRLAVPLKEGLNDLRLTITGQPLAASFRVIYEPARTPVTLKVNLPGSTKDAAIQGVIQTAPYAMVTVKSLKAQADWRGETPFVIPLEEGVNTLEITATTVAGNTASWKGLVIRDSMPPSVNLNLPVLTNQQNFTVTGTVEPGASLTLNDAVVSVDAMGAFRQPITLTEGKASVLTFKVADAAGNRAEQTASITYSATVPAVSLREGVTLSGKVAPGTSLTYQGQRVLVGLDGSFKLDVKLNVGTNSFVLSASSGGKSTGFLQFDVLLPVRLDAPAALPSGQVTLSGKTLPGYLVAVNGQLATVQADGTFTATFDKKGAIAVVTIIGDGKTHTLEVPMD